MHQFDGEDQGDGHDETTNLRPRLYGEIGLYRILTFGDVVHKYLHISLDLY